MGGGDWRKGQINASAGLGLDVRWLAKKGRPPASTTTNNLIAARGAASDKAGTSCKIWWGKRHSLHGISSVATLTGISKRSRHSRLRHSYNYWKFSYDVPW